MSADWLSGVHSVGEWLRADPSRILRLMVAPRSGDRVDKLIRRAVEAGIPVERSNPAALKQLAGPRNPQGVIAEVRPFPFADLETVLAGVGDPPLLLLVDGVTDPGNLGAIIRSAGFFGLDAVLLPRDRSAAISPVVERAAAGAAAQVPICQVNSLLRTVETLQERGYLAVASVLGSHPAPAETDLSGPRVLMLGSEGKGLRPSLRRAADLKLALPSRGPGSLNVSAFGAVLLYETWRQRQSP